MLLDDRFVGCFGTVAAGDKSLIAKIAVDAARRGFGVVPMQADAVNTACALGVRDSKKEHDCYHVMTEDTKVRAAFNRLIKADEQTNLAIDIGASNIGITSDVSWWVGSEISPTMLGLDGEAIYVFDLTDADPEQIRGAGLTLEGLLLVPPTTDAEAGDYVQLVGQMNSLTDNVEKEDTGMNDDDRNNMASDFEDGIPEGTVVVNPDKDEYRMEIPDTLWNNEAQDFAALSARLDDLSATVEGLTETIGRLQEALVVALTAMKELRDGK